MEVDSILKNRNIDYNSLLEWAFECLKIPVVILNAAGVCIKGNRAFWEFVGPAQNAIASEIQITDYVVPKDRETIREALGSLSQGGTVDEVQTRLVSRSGQTVAVTLHLGLLPDQEFILASVSSIKDSLRARKEYQRRTEDLENLFYLISHNLKSPLVSIQGFINLLLDNKGEGEHPELYHYLERIRKNAERMNTMVQDILTFSKISKKQHIVNQYALADIINTIYTEHYFRLKEKKIKLRVPTALPTIRADKEGIATVFENLLDNAIKYMGDVEQPEIEIGWEDKGHFLAFWVSDNGLGLPQEYQKKVFNLFERGDTGRQRDVEGTGVGLAIVKKIVEQHGGMVRLVSKEGEGTTVHFTLPVPEKSKA